MLVLVILVLSFLCVKKKEKQRNTNLRTKIHSSYDAAITDPIFTIH